MSDVSRRFPYPLLPVAAVLLVLIVVAFVAYHVGATSERIVVGTANPVPVAITGGRVEVEDSVWTIMAGIGTVALAVATFSLAWYTLQLANETRSSLTISKAALAAENSARAAEAERHQDSFMPHIALLCEDQGAEHKTPGGVIKQVFATELHVKNVGVGPALNVRVTAQRIGGDVAFNQVPVSLAVGDKDWAARGMGGEVLKYSVNYEDVFGRRYRSSLDGMLKEATPYEWERL